MKALSFRLSFLVIALLATLAQAGDDAVRVRIAAANISSGSDQSYDPGHGIRIFKAAKPDVVAIQEFNYGNKSPEAIRKFVDDTFGKEFSYYREPKGRIPNGIISRHPIVESGSWPDPIPGIKDRGFAWAKIRLPSGEHMYVVSVHFHTKSAPNRDTEARELVRLIKANFPKNAKVVIAGDLNTKYENEPAIKTLAQVASESHSPVGADGEKTTNAKRNKRYDWVLTSPSLDQHHQPVELEAEKGVEPKKGVHIFPEGLVFDTRVMRALPKPAERDDSDAEAMQHMMVVKDFVIPSPKPHVEEKKDGGNPNPTH